MGIKLASAPADGMSIVQQGLATLNRASSRRAMLGGVLMRASVHQPQEVYTLALDTLAQGGDLGSAKPTGWRYLISDGREPIETASLSPKPGGAGHDFIGVNQGPLIAEAGLAMIVAEKLDVVQKEDYEVRWLQIPGIYVQAVWLKNLNGPDDQLVPFHVRPPLQNNCPYGVDDFLSVVRALAKTRLQFSDEPGK